MAEESRVKNVIVDVKKYAEEIKKNFEKNKKNVTKTMFHSFYYRRTKE